MDALDKILLQHLPDTGLCARGKAKQADRRYKLKAAILSLLHKNDYVQVDDGTVYSGFVVIDEKQLGV